jgi:hypothetical protein
MTLAPRETAKGVRRYVLNSAPLPEIEARSLPAITAGNALHSARTTAPSLPAIANSRTSAGNAANGPEKPAKATDKPATKRDRLMTLYKAHALYGDAEKASRVASELAPMAGLQAGTARSYIYAEIKRIQAEADTSGTEL